jgi:Peptidase of plants and bacteria
MRMVKINSHRHVVLCLLVSVALHLCGCASGRPIVSTNNTPPGNASVRNVDFSEAPEARALAERARQIGNEMYPRVVALLADDSSKIPRQFDIIFKEHLKTNEAGRAIGKKIRLDASLLEKNPKKLEAILIHEMAHLTQALHWYKPFPTAWKCWMEGIPEYARFKLGDTNGWRCPQCSFENPHYTYGYACAGAFLLFVDATCGSNVVRQLNGELRRRAYSDSFFARATGKNLDELWGQFQKTPAFTPVAAKVAKLYNALGYVNGKPPANVRARFEAYLKQQGEASQLLLIPGHAVLLMSGNARVAADFMMAEVKGELADDVLRLYAHFQHVQQTAKAAQFVASLDDTGQLPGFSPGELKKISPGWSDEDCDREMARTFACTKDGDPSTYHYIVVQESTDAPWRLQKAWRTGPDGRVIEEYPNL